ncbi:phosphatidate cytidylyltransferase [Altererythrobacter sp. KTW20L]|uniref:phosphatidate cytidylyltransferase n=1 Tax=Altererythrobacter sp. KTW20L TaxID=2942210 RepID=UPI0020BEC81F|nr:phosphatidate cytidylyltransferase [Altererythrobacter sp. KTW20L]MCL6251248.1 phosphatidate cytidylyltransferase [Altererythrobacter sp. KTW20L]
MTDESVPVPLTVKTSDLKVRTLSAVVMLLVAGGALWLGGIFLQAFIALVAIATLGEFVRLVWKASAKTLNRALSVLAGLLYISVAAVALASGGPSMVVILVGSVIAVDTFAYFSGRTFGGPKIAPRISPSKTWAGLIGGAFGASLFFVAMFQGVPAYQCWRYLQLPEDQTQFAFDGPCSYMPWAFNLTNVVQVLLVGLVVAVVAQCGDFFESWLKRKAGVKDSSNLIPGHGGVFDRTDGVLAVSFVVGIVMLTDRLI